MTTSGPILSGLDSIDRHSADPKALGKGFLHASYLLGGLNRRYVIWRQLGGMIISAASAVARVEAALAHHVSAIGLLGAKPQVRRIHARRIVA